MLGAGAFGPLTTAATWVGSASSSINSVVFTDVANLSGSFGPNLSGGPPGGGTMGLTGVSKICLIFTVCEYANVTILLSSVSGSGFGTGGTLTYPGDIGVTMQNSPWTLGQPSMTFHTSGTSTVTTPLPGGFAHGPATLTSSTAGFSGVLQLVTVSKIYTSLYTGFPDLPVIGIVNLRLVPEPGTLVLLASGVSILAIPDVSRFPWTFGAPSRVDG